MLTDKSSKSSSNKVQPNSYIFAGKPAGLATSTDIFTKELFCFLSFLENQNAKPAISLATDNSSQIKHKLHKFSTTDSQDPSTPADTKTSHNQGY